jgi:hypothetical protein
MINKKAYQPRETGLMGFSFDCRTGRCGYYGQKKRLRGTTPPADRFLTDRILAARFLAARFLAILSL